jgi:hypothetical protein
VDHGGWYVPRAFSVCQGRLCSIDEGAQDVFQVARELSKGCGESVRGSPMQIPSVDRPMEQFFEEDIRNVIETCMPYAKRSIWRVMRVV